MDYDWAGWVILKQINLPVSLIPYLGAWNICWGMMLTQGSETIRATMQCITPLLMDTACVWSWWDDLKSCDSVYAFNIFSLLYFCPLHQIASETPLDVVSAMTLNINTFKIITALELSDLIRSVVACLEVNGNLRDRHPKWLWCTCSCEPTSPGCEYSLHLFDQQMLGNIILTPFNSLLAGVHLILNVMVVLRHIMDITRLLRYWFSLYWTWM